MKIGARDLLDAYGSQRKVAEAHLRGELTRVQEQFVWDVIGREDVEAAKTRLTRESWRLVDRVKALEEEIAELKRQQRPSMPIPGCRRHVEEHDFLTNNVQFNLEAWQRDHPGGAHPLANPEDRRPLRDRPELHQYCYVEE